MDDFTAFVVGVAAGASAAVALLWYALLRYLTRK